MKNINSYVFHILKFGKIKSFYYKLKKNRKKILQSLKLFFKNSISLYLIKLKNRKGDNCLVGEIGIINYFYFNKLK